MELMLAVPLSDFSSPDARMACDASAGIWREVRTESTFLSSSADLGSVEPGVRGPGRRRRWRGDLQPRTYFLWFARHRVSGGLYLWRNARLQRSGLSAASFRHEDWALRLDLRASVGCP